MTNEMVEARITTMESSINEIKDNLKTLPDTIANKINENVDMKIKLAISETEKKYQSKLIGLLIAIIGEGVGLVISFLKLGA
ncbi:MAG: hypothetical protein II453_15295 [Alphaproteobacteria bacterium]|jgi:hypothetical protein|nr:hypothetical protein [Alphaproteobacteria bacterium]